MCVTVYRNQYLDHKIALKDFFSSSFSFKIIMDVAKSTDRPCMHFTVPHNGYVLHNYRTTSQPGDGHATYQSIIYLSTNHLSSSTISQPAISLSIIYHTSTQSYKDHIQSDSIYMGCPEQGSVQRQKVDQWFPRAGRRNVEGMGEWVLVGIESLRGDKNVLKLYFGDGYTILWLYWNTLNCIFSMGESYGMWIIFQ